MNDIILRSAPSSESLWPSLIALVPHLIWLCALIGFLLWMGRDGLHALFKRVDKVSIAGVELQFRDDLAAAAASRGLTLANDDLGSAARRLAGSKNVVAGARLLWIDDVPAGIVQESRLFEQSGAHVTRALSTTEAFAKLDKKNYDLVLSDIQRGDDPQAGISFSVELAARQNAPPLIFYVGTVQKPRPEHAFGITNRPDELVHLVLDVLARVRS